MSRSRQRLHRLGRCAAGLAACLVVALHGAGCFLLPKADWLDAHAPPANLATHGFTLHHHVAPAADARWNVVFI
ncbi:MAG: hypothetical protein ACKVYV_02355, partial [Limisphaerales bacterium]